MKSLFVLLLLLIFSKDTFAQDEAFCRNESLRVLNSTLLLISDSVESPNKSSYQSLYNEAEQMFESYTCTDRDKYAAQMLVVGVCVHLNSDFSRNQIHFADMATQEAVYEQSRDIRLDHYYANREFSCSMLDDVFDVNRVK